MIKPFILLVTILIIFPIPTNAVGADTTVIIIPGSGNAPPTIDDVDITTNQGGTANCIGDKLFVDILIKASDINGVNDINEVFVTLYKKRPSTGELIWKNEGALPLFTTVNPYTTIYKDMLMYQGKLPGSYVLKVEVFDKSGTVDSEQVNFLTIMVLGDFSGDGCVDPYDITHLARHIVGTTGYEDIYSAEVTGDGGLDVADIYYLGQAIVGNPGYPLE